MSGKPFYPSLMQFPALTDAAREYIRVEANARLGSGSQEITAGQAELHHALASNDYAAMQTGLRQVRQGLYLGESGAGALQALNEAQPPRQIALTWFKREMSVSDDSDKVIDGGFRDLSWLHLAAMLLLTAALFTALIFHWARLRRISTLVDRLTPGSEAAPQPNGTSVAVNNPKSPAPVTPSKPQTPATPAAPATLNTPPVIMAKTKPQIQRPWAGVLRTEAIFDEAPNVKTFRLMEPNLGPMPFTFLAGQYATLTSEIDGQKVRRSYTISSSPTQRDYIELTIKREQHGLESRYMHDHTKTGDLLEITAPSGKFFFTGKEADGIVLIAGGVGITPMMSILRYLCDRSYSKQIHLLYAARTPSDIIFREECLYLARRHANVHVDVIVSAMDGTAWEGAVGLMTPDFIVKAVPDITQHRIHLCGPPPMMDAVKIALLQLKVSLDQVKTEDFAPPKGGPVLSSVPADASANPQPVAAQAGTSPATIPPTEDGVSPEDSAISIAEPADPSPSSQSGNSIATPPAPAPSAQATISFSKSGKSGQLAPDQSVLEAAEAIGVAIDFECRVGTCGRCKV
ncbi:MAG: 2Fe-2S iron-sulfur cluster binding domain-containing protein, partial [Rickettsiales bacterium]|nr:2Fe-2S iron-sulfur cluster binding domain-containing protein [Rickettsiales bacterium]